MVLFCCCCHGLEEDGGCAGPALAARRADGKAAAAVCEVAVASARRSKRLGRRENRGFKCSADLFSRFKLEARFPRDLLLVVVVVVKWETLMAST